MLKRFEKDLRKLESSVDYGSDYSIYTGSTGVVALYWLIANVDLDDSSIDKTEGKKFAVKRLEKQQVSSETAVVYCWSFRCHSLQEAIARIETILPKLKQKRMSFLAGDAGPLALAIMIYHSTNEMDKVKFYWKK